jgi:hypothetical protein
MEILTRYPHTGLVFDDDYKVVGFSWNLYAIVIDLEGKTREDWIAKFAEYNKGNGRG